MREAFLLANVPSQPLGINSKKLRSARSLLIPRPSASRPVWTGMRLNDLDPGALISQRYSLEYSPGVYSNDTARRYNRPHSDECCYDMPHREHATHQVKTHPSPYTQSNSSFFSGCIDRSRTTQASKTGRSTKAFSSSPPSTGEPCCKYRFFLKCSPSNKKYTLTLIANTQPKCLQGIRAERFGHFFPPRTI